MPRLPLLLAIGLLFSCATRPAVVTIPEDEPGSADAYYAMKRQGAANPHERYAAARERMRRMERYSTVDAAGSSAGPSASDDRRPAFPAGWTFLGPGNIGGRTRVLIIDPVDPTVMYAGGVSGGLWKSVNAGERWEPVGDALANLAVNSLAMDPSDRRVLYAGTGEGYFREEVRGTGLPLRGNGIFVTSDAGATWTHLASTATNDFHWVNDLEVSRHDPRRLYAATRTGVWRSSDAGASWSNVLPVTVRGGCLDLAARPDAPTDYLFASCGTFDRATIHRSTDAASASWEAVHSEEGMSRTSLAIAPSRPSTIYALAAHNGDPNTGHGLHAVYRSDSNGDPGSWTAQVRLDDPDLIDRNLLTNLWSVSQRKCGVSNNDNPLTMGWYCNVIAVDPADAEKVWVGGVDLFRSDDGGRNWGVASYWWASSSEGSFAHADHHGIVFHPRYDGAANQTMFSTNDGGIYRTENARAAVARGDDAPCNPIASQVTFAHLNRNFGVTQFYHGAVTPDGKRVLGGTQDNGTIVSDIARGTDSWTRILGGDGGYVAVDPRNPAVFYAEAQNAYLVRFNAGGFGSPVNRGLLDDFLFVTPFVLDPNDADRLWIAGRSLWRSENRGDEWSRASIRLPAYVSAIAVAPGRSNRVVAATTSGDIHRSENALTATAATGWPSSRPRDGFVTSLTFHPTNADIVYATYGGFGGVHVWRSIDGGATWSPIDGSGAGTLPDIPAHSLAVDPYDTQRLYLGTDLGVFVSLDGGASWRVENSGFAAVVTETVVIGRGERGPAVYAFTHGRGAWRAELVPAGRRRTVGR